MSTRPQGPDWPELWGGVEATINRVGERWFDQAARSGRGGRPELIEHFAGLGLRALRYPVLWERVAPGGLEGADWAEADAGLQELRRLGLRPILGLLHHGSGPAGTDLLDAEFPLRFANYARAVAQRYPWVVDYTPINEPLTTARFSALYGHWYPHRRDLASFHRALVNQCRAIVMAMEAIRGVQAGARLIQTEDVGRVYSTAPLAYQADYENERRWLSFDLLCGRVAADHPLYASLRDSGVGEAELDVLAARPCAPQVLGVNYYLTSERFIDHRLQHYPAALQGGNGRDRYVDVEAARVGHLRLAGHEGIVREAWQRYGRPLALTEVHNGCTREEQMRWVREAWCAAVRLRREGVPLQAVTAWALLGSWDWDSLVTRQAGHYECGVFDDRSLPPRPTALAGMVRQLAREGRCSHPALDGTGWWRRAGRCRYRPPGSRVTAERAAKTVRRSPRPLLVAGAGGTLGRALLRVAGERGLACIGLPRTALDIADPGAVREVLRRLRPWAVINAAGYVRVDQAENEPVRCFRENAEGAGVLAAVCGEHQVRLLTYSSDLIFGGRAPLPARGGYHEADTPAPLNVYGASKAEAERRVLARLSSALVIRTSAFFSPWDGANFVVLALQRLRRGQRLAAAEDWIVTPTYVPALVQNSLDLLIDGEQGVWHLACRGEISWAGLARAVARLGGCDPGLVDGVPGSTLGLQAARPTYSALVSGRGQLMPCYDAMLGACVALL